MTNTITPLCFCFFERDGKEAHRESLPVCHNLTIRPASEALSWSPTTRSTAPCAASLTKSTSKEGVRGRIVMAALVHVASQSSADSGRRDFPTQMAMPPSLEALHLLGTAVKCALGVWVDIAANLVHRDLLSVEVFTLRRRSAFTVHLHHPCKGITSTWSVQHRAASHQGGTKYDDTLPFASSWLR